MLDQELAANPLLQSDKELRMFCLIVKGDFDGESDTPAMRQDWTEVASLAQALGNTRWQYRAQGQLGFADFYDGDLPGAQRNVAQALIGTTKTGDIGGQLFYLSMWMMLIAFCGGFGVNSEALGANAGRVLCRVKAAGANP